MTGSCLYPLFLCRKGYTNVLGLACLLVWLGMTILHPELYLDVLLSVKVNFSPLSFTVAECNVSPFTRSVLRCISAVWVCLYPAISLLWTIKVVYRHVTFAEFSGMSYRNALFCIEIFRILPNFGSLYFWHHIKESSQIFIFCIYNLLIHYDLDTWWWCVHYQAQNRNEDVLYTRWCCVTRATIHNSQ